MLNVALAKKKIILLGILLSLSVWELGTAAYIHAKAHLAQILIARAWQESLARQQPVKPWSWADTYPVGRLVVPALGIDHYVLAGGSGRTLAFGPGHHDDSVYPGEIGRTVVSGHRDTHFTFLKDVKIGQVIDFQNTTGHWLRFEVRDILIMNVKEQRLALESAIPTLALITCYPFEAILPGGPLRYVVVAELAGDETHLQGLRH